MTKIYEIVKFTIHIDEYKEYKMCTVKNRIRISKIVASALMVGSFSSVQLYADVDKKAEYSEKIKEISTNFNNTMNSLVGTSSTWVSAAVAKTAEKGVDSLADYTIDAIDQEICNINSNNDDFFIFNVNSKTDVRKNKSFIFKFKRFYDAFLSEDTINFFIRMLPKDTKTLLTNELYTIQDVIQNTQTAKGKIFVPAEDKLMTMAANYSYALAEGANYNHEEFKSYKDLIAKDPALANTINYGTSIFANVATAGSSKIGSAKKYFNATVDIKDILTHTIKNILKNKEIEAQVIQSENGNTITVSLESESQEEVELAVKLLSDKYSDDIKTYFKQKFGLTDEEVNSKTSYQLLYSEVGAVIKDLLYYNRLTEFDVNPLNMEKTNIIDAGLNESIVSKIHESLKDFKVKRNCGLVSVMPVFRTPNPESNKWIDAGYLMKPMDIKAKTLTDEDYFISAYYQTLSGKEYYENIIGLAAIFEPIKEAELTSALVSQYATLAQISNDSAERILKKRIQKRQKEFEHKNEYVKHLDDYYTIAQNTGVISLLKPYTDGSGKVFATGTKVTADYDLWDIRDEHGDPISKADLLKAIDILDSKGIIMHGAISTFSGEMFNDEQKTINEMFEQKRSLVQDGLDGKLMAMKVDESGTEIYDAVATHRRFFEIQEEVMQPTPMDSTAWEKVNPSSDNDNSDETGDSSQDLLIDGIQVIINEDIEVDELVISNNGIVAFQVSSSNGTLIGYKNLSTGENDIISKKSNGSPLYGSEYPSISDDGNFITFIERSEFDSLYIKNMITGSLDRIDGGYDEYYNSYISGNGEFITAEWDYPGTILRIPSEGFDFENLGSSNVVNWNPQIGSSSFSKNYSNLTPTISFDGRYIAFISAYDKLISNDTNKKKDIFVRDMVDNKVILVSSDSENIQNNNHSSEPSISGNGKFVVFSSDEGNLNKEKINPYRSHIFMKNIETGALSVVSSNINGIRGNNSSTFSLWTGHRGNAITFDGRYVVFASKATNLTTDVVNSSIYNVYVKDTISGVVKLVSKNKLGIPGDDHSSQARISSNGKYIVFMSNADNLADNQPNVSGASFVVLNPFLFPSDKDIPKISINKNTSVVETNLDKTQAIFTVSLSEPTTEDVTFTYRARSKTALNGTDFINTIGNGTIKAGETSVVINIDVFGDSIYEEDETFEVVIEGIKGAKLASLEDRISVATIINDDEKIYPVAIGYKKSVIESNLNTSKTAKVLVKLTKVASEDVTIDYQTKDGTAKFSVDYMPQFGTITIPKGSDSAYINIDIIGNDRYEGDKTFEIVYSNPKNTRFIKDEFSSQVVIIENDEMEIPATNNVLNLKLGWNLVSLPTNIVLLEEELTTKFGSDTIIWTYNNDAVNKWSVHLNNTTLPTSVNPIDKITYPQGFWVKSTTAKTVSFDTTANFPYKLTDTQKLINASRGWHLLGTGTTQTISDINSAKSNISLMWKYVNGAWQTTYDGTLPSGITSMSDVKAGEGVWVLVQ
jgi:hypothetical protein